MPKRYAKYGLFLLSRDYQVVWATMMGNECFMIILYFLLINKKIPEKNWEKANTWKWKYLKEFDLENSQFFIDP